MSDILFGCTNILIGCTGSVASIKIVPLVKLLQQQSTFPQVVIKVVATAHALHFFDRNELTPLGVEVLTEEDEWKAWSKKTDPVMHIDLRNWADLIVVAPLDANTLGKLANGLCDNLLTCILRAWDVSKPVLLAPAMNTHMYNHPLTAIHLDTVTRILGYKIIAPISKLLACGDIGIGAMAEVTDISERVAAERKEHQPDSFF
ncbi:putative phosphopantothenoylcysteine decarboxylase [Chytriomyces cf. hyalinus JEL632]|nr:putative phosphopantothenoylcysteine decarboxylase [Chytriomyces cf. hyalinus JEL632]